MWCDVFFPTLSEEDTLNYIVHSPTTVNSHMSWNGASENFLELAQPWLSTCLNYSNLCSSYLPVGSVALASS